MGDISQGSLTKDTLIKVDRKIMETNFFGPVALTKALVE
ncbi:dehydrogenases [Candidatus Brocadia sinica JPN1]|uniref:Dehydrogenases n=1 Tax=Candidatus Brocadia sinica JPN1 TaxID=1197129 RepID=A0ABQ0JXM3_9BACT|nr:dehydrogenases [Candidatus Brocadia sinica JPN1]